LSDVTDPYCFPGTSVLRNKLGFADALTLGGAERDLVELRDVQLKMNPLSGTYDLSHLREFHRSLFQDVYEWAGELRTVDIVKDSAYFCKSELIESQAVGIFAAMNAEGPLSKDVEEAANWLGFHLGEINALHPFREGNGRAQRALIWQYARDGGWNIDWTQVDPDENSAASWEAMAGSSTRLSNLILSVISPVISPPSAGYAS